MQMRKCYFCEIIEFFRSDTLCNENIFVPSFGGAARCGVQLPASRGWTETKGTGNNFLEDCASKTIKMFMGDGWMSNISFAGNIVGCWCQLL